MTYEIKSLQMLKAFCAIFIICLHVLFQGRNHIVPIIKVAVPCFYMISGYFLADNQGNINLFRVKKQFKKLIKLTITTNLVYYIVLSCIHKEFLDIFDLGTLLRLFLYGDVLDVPLWFMTAYIEALALVLILFKFKETIEINLSLLPIITLLLATALITGRYSSITGCQYDELFYRNVFNSAIPFMYYGAIIRKYYNRISCISNNTILILFISLLVLSYMEYGFQYLYPQYCGIGDLNFFTIPLAIIIFIYCLNHQSSNLIKYEWCIYIGREYSTYIYLYHWLILGLLWFYYEPFMLKKETIIPVIVIILSVLLAAIIKRLSSFYQLIKQCFL